MVPSLDDLKNDYRRAANAAADAMMAACDAADKADAVGPGEAREHFKEQEAKALQVYENWRQASDNLRKRIYAEAARQ